eukprot:TRINITY_DN1304_c0_g1_i1.p1 TRINITY_DN1304_c0_g1~~TRINITY_DN1304_c0_g1_i1.p1  ORF type:complete len:711 (+),score=120.10 TRINITY_DN1304_c0_g1_i1:120-2252(+)
MEAWQASECPTTRRDESVLEQGVPDPYRWLEDPDSPETQAWVTQQNNFTNKLLTASPVREKFVKRLTELYNYPKFSCPYKRGTKYYYYKNDGLQNQSVLYTQDSLESEPSVFLDPNTLTADGTAALGVTAFSESGKYFAYGVSRSGSDWQTIYVKRTADKTDTEEVLKWVKFSSIAWLHSDEGFFYARYPTPTFVEGDAEAPKAGAEVDANVDHKLYYHKLGTSQDEDVLIFDTPEEPKLMFGIEITDDGKYLLITVYKGTAPANKLYYAELAHFIGTRESLNVVKLIDNFEAEYQYITNDDTLFHVKSNRSADRNKILTIDIAHPAPESWKDLIPESTDVLSYACCFNQSFLLVCYLHDVKDILQVFSLDGKFLKELELPDIGSVGSITCRRKDAEVFYSFTSFLRPSSIFRVAPDGSTSVFREPIVNGFNPADFQSQQVFYNSKDGTRIPMFIVSRKTQQEHLDGSGAVYLYGYGGFNISLQPSFSVFRVVFMTHCNIAIAIPNLRGGGEYGEEWHKQGTFERKQNVFDDFISAAEYLVANKWCSPERIAISGGSNGGLLVGACANQRPDLFGCAIAQVGVMDMLRFHKFTIGHAWTEEYGNPDDAEAAAYIKKYSPVHNVQTEKPYPAVLLTTGDHDDRVVPLHSYKYIAALQHAHGKSEKQTKPLMIRIDCKAGHGAGKPTAKAIEETADIYTFIHHTLRLEWRDV